MKCRLPKSINNPSNIDPPFDEYSYDSFNGDDRNDDPDNETIIREETKENDNPN